MLVASFALLQRLWFRFALEAISGTRSQQDPDVLGLSLKSKTSHTMTVAFAAELQQHWLRPSCQRHQVV